MNQSDGKSVFHRPPSIQPGQGSRSTIKEPPPVQRPSAKASAQTLDPRILWALGGLAGFLIFLVAFGFAGACILSISAALGWLIWQRRKTKGPIGSSVSPIRAVGWGLVGLGLLVIVLAFPWANAERETRFKVALAMAGRGMRSSQDWTDVSPWPVAGVGGAIGGLGVLVLAIRPPTRK